MLWALLALIRSGGTLFMLSNRCQHESCSRQPTIAGRLCDKVAGDVLRIPWAWIASFLGQIDEQLAERRRDGRGQGNRGAPLRRRLSGTDGSF